MKKILLLLVIFTLGESQAQQVSLNSQYMFNYFAINPAVAGTKNYTPITFSVRRQWMGMDDAPVTQSAMAHTFFGEKSGIGAHVFNDVAGPTRRTGFSATFGHQIQVSKASRLSFGASAALTQFILDKDKLVTEIPNDLAIQNSTNNQMIPDFNFGLYWYGERFYVGLSAFNLLETKTDLFDITTTVSSTLDRTFYFHGGYTLAISDNFAIDPSVMFRYMLNAPFQIDGNARFIYKDAYWLGVSYRLEDAIAIMAGTELGKISFGYSFDLTMSDLATYNTGSHEVFLRVKLSNNSKAKTPWHKRNRIYSSFPE